MQPESILHFWFEELTVKQHFVNDAARLCAGRAGAGVGARIGGERSRPQPAARAARVCLHALQALHHSESALVHAQAVTLFSQLGMQDNLDFELRHKAIIDRFGRFPHRNVILGWTSSAQELAFLGEPGSAF
jgi:uncharacterized protein (DUF924 family)